ncbi:hypothetical protein BJX61DRAFT_121274 [Aspergillus egyptiacus]|nr:hypothetical protein BJX61DRAFT_121274 [Aspergillus egyptiacus]
MRRTFICRFLSETWDRLPTSAPPWPLPVSMCRRVPSINISLPLLLLVSHMETWEIGQVMVWRRIYSSTYTFSMSWVMFSVDLFFWSRKTLPDGITTPCPRPSEHHEFP